jgi:hypothetical protein
MAIAFEQICSDPVFKRTDAPAEGRLRYMTQLGRTREISRIYQCQEVLQPSEFHELCQTSIGPMSIRHWPIGTVRSYLAQGEKEVADQ